MVRKLFFSVVKKLCEVVSQVFFLIRECFFHVPSPEYPSQYPPSQEDKVCTVLKMKVNSGEGSIFTANMADRGVKPSREQPVCLPEKEEGPVVRSAEFLETPSLLGEQHISLCETLDRVLNTGVVIHGDITISVANIDLIYIGLRALLSSVETAQKL